MRLAPQPSLGSGPSSGQSSAARPHLAELPRCLQCGVVAARGDLTFCRRCGLPYGEPPPPNATLPSCPICYREMEPDGRLPARSGGHRLDLVAHVQEHERYPVGDDDYLESLREGDRIRIGRWYAPFEPVRRYFVTGSVDAGRRRTMEHDAIVTAMSQLRRWGADGVILGDQPQWQEARAAVSAVMERYIRGRV
ncbi:MAG TPA: hypothetical protein VNF73_03595 [Candidatus Saccharimonadales bacterium]|nr:hypothetical protein [Candidatus Saccharimonadales bacterium]